MIPEGIRYTVRLTFLKDEKTFGPGVARLMELVDEKGSMAEACREMGMAYSKAWKIVNRAEKDLGIELMAGERGGKNGGSMRLTEEGRDLLLRYRAMESELKSAAEDLYQKHFG